MTAVPDPRPAPTAEQVRAAVAAALEAIDAGRAEAPEGAHGSGRSPAPVPLADLAVGADHGGFALKERIAADLKAHGFTVHDCGTRGTESVDYPDFAHAVARLVADGGCRRGILVDGAGIGSCMAANKVPGVRAATCWDVSSAQNASEHNHANVLVLGAGFVGEALALQIVQAWISTPWGGDRHARRVEKIDAIERRYLSGVRS